MAVISELVRVIADVEGLEENFVSVYARAAREAGYISHFGRGRNAAKMSPRDAANLLIAVNASDLAKNVPETIEKYSSLLKKNNSEHLIQGNKLADELSAFGLTFVDALEILLSSNAEGKSNVRLLLEAARDPWTDDIKDHMRAMMWVEFKGPYPGARILIGSNPGDPIDFYKTRSKLDVSYYYPGDRPLSEVFGDKQTQTSISHVTMMAVANALAN